MTPTSRAWAVRSQWSPTRSPLGSTRISATFLGVADLVGSESDLGEWVVAGGGGVVGLSEHPTLSRGDLEPLLGSGVPSAPPPGDERQRLRDALLEADGDKRRAAEILGTSYRTLQRKVRELDLEGFPKYRD